MPRLRAPATPALACLVLLLAGQAAAREAVTLRWDAPASCPAAAFHAPLRRYLGARAPTSTLAVRARVREPAPGRWQLDLGVRPPRAPPPPLRLALRLGGGLSGGALPAPAGELNLLLGLLGPRWRLDLLARGVLPSRARSGLDPTVRARIGLWTLGARACFVPARARARLEFPLCAGAELGQLLARSEGLARNGRADLVWAAVTASPALAWTPRPWLALVLAAHLAVPLIHHDFLVRGLPRLHALGPVQAGGSLAVEWRFAPVRARPRP